MDMKVARFYTKGDVRIDEVPVEQPKGDEVQIKVKWCGICGSDIHEFEGGPMQTPGDTPHAITGCTNPVTLGHEFCGEVVATGPDCTRFKVGDRVIPQPFIACGECVPCKEGKLNLCEHLSFAGFSSNNGGFGEYCNFTEKLCHSMPDNLSYEMGALVEPISVGWHSLREGNFQPGQVAIVAGCGPIGLSVIASLKAKGAGKIIAVQRKGIRQEYAKKYGADVVLDPNEVDVVSEVRKMTGNKGADLAFETTSSEEIFHLIRKAVCQGGTEVVISIWTENVSINLTDLVYSGKRIVSSMCYDYQDFEEVIDALSSGELKAPGYITKKIYVGDVVEEGFRTLMSPEKKKHIKVLVTPEKELIG